LAATADVNKQETTGNSGLSLSDRDAFESLYEIDQN